METYLAIASRREERAYLSDPVPRELEERILQAGRISGSAKNRQAWSFTVIRRDEAFFKSLSDAVTAPRNVVGAQLLILISIEGTMPTMYFDAGRAAQNMMLAAWDAGIGSSPNTVKDPGAIHSALGLSSSSVPVTLLSFGYPVRRPKVESRTAEHWLSSADRRPMNEIARVLTPHGPGLISDPTKAQS